MQVERRRRAEATEEWRKRYDIRAGIEGTNSELKLDEFRQGFEADASKKLLQNVVTQHDVNDVALSRSIVADSPHSFSIMLDDWSVTNQAKSGRCWMFAGLNVCRTDTRKLLKVKDFEFSQNFLMFWDRRAGAGAGVGVQLQADNQRAVGTVPCLRKNAWMSFGRDSRQTPPKSCCKMW